jgi:hypothetical protein
MEREGGKSGRRAAVYELATNRGGESGEGWDVQTEAGTRTRGGRGGF